MTKASMFLYIILILFVVVLIILLQRYRKCENTIDHMSPTNACRFWSFGN